MIDIGCGSGALTDKLSKMGFRTLGVDASADMLELAAKNYPELNFVQGDACSFLPEEPADAVFSNAVFHWIDGQRQQGMMKNIADMLKPGGQLVFEFGGRGCAQNVHSTLESIFQHRGYDYRRVFYFPTVGEYAPVVENAGLSVRYAVLFDRPTQLSGSLGDWIRMFVKEPFCGIGEKEKEEIIAQTEKQLEDKLFRNGKWYVDYVRIRMSAYKTVN